jgi:predicted AAA+ superfamily ATPase
MSESGHSTNQITIRKLLAGEEVAATDPGLTVADLADRLAIGGWPANLTLTANQARRAMRGYIEEICNVDIQRLDGVRRDPRSVTRLIQSLARNSATPAKLQALVDDANGTDGNLKISTARVYLDALARLHITDDVPAWQPDLRSRTRLRAASVRHLADPALAVAALEASPARLLGDLRLFGFLFESMVVRDLKVYAEALGAEVFHYRDENGLEADAVLELSNGGWAAFEVKLGSSKEVVDRAAENLLAIRAKVASGVPIALGVITGTGYGLTRSDGVLQIPVGALGY